jgi:hypothetical protein
MEFPPELRNTVPEPLVNFVELATEQEMKAVFEYVCVHVRIAS